MAEEDTTRWCGELTDHELHARPFQLPSAAFQLRHIARSLDRFCSLRAGPPLTPEQFKALGGELSDQGTHETIFTELKQSLETTCQRLNSIALQSMDKPIGHRAEKDCRQPWEGY